MILDHGIDESMVTGVPIPNIFHSGSGVYHEESRALFVAM